MSNRNRTAGHDYERKIVRELKELGFECAVTTRSESRNMDNKKIDVMGDCIPHYIQTKTLNKSFDYNKFFKAMKEVFSKLKKPVIFFHKQTKKSPKGKFINQGEYVIMEKETYYDILRKLSENGY